MIQQQDRQGTQDLSAWKQNDDDDELLDDLTVQQVDEYIPQQQQQQQQTETRPEIKRGYKINVANARLELKLLKKMIYRNGWKEVYQNGDVCWLGLPFKYDNLDEYLVQRVNRFPGMDMLAHKVQTAFYLKKFYKYFPGEYEFFPKTYNLPEEYDEFDKEFKTKKTYIAKPDAGSQGEGIYFIKNKRDIRSNECCVIQEYLAKPLLIDNKKFDLRLYVLVASIEPLVCYINDEGLARFCTVDYQKPDEKNIRNPFMHLTNYSLNKRSVDFKVLQGSNIYDINDATKRTFTSIKKNLEIQGYNNQEIQDKINELVSSFMKSVYPFLVYNCKLVFQKKYDEMKCFQILGFDILLDKDGKPWLLEVNSNPSVSIDHEVFSKDGKSIHEESFLDTQVKYGVVQDAICISMKSKEQLQETDRFGTYQKLDIEEQIGETVISKMLQIYGHLSGYKFQETITSSKFVKLSQFPQMTNQQFVKYDYELTYKKILLKQGANQMDFFQFVTAIEFIAKRLQQNVEEMVDRISHNL